MGASSLSSDASVMAVFTGSLGVGFLLAVFRLS